MMELPSSNGLMVRICDGLMGVLRGGEMPCMCVPSRRMVGKIGGIDGGRREKKTKRKTPKRKVPERETQNAFDHFT
jgi:hypothetical protein